MSLGMHWAFFGRIRLAIPLLAPYPRRGAGRGGKRKGMHDCTPAAATITTPTPRTPSHNLTSQAACSRPHLQANSVFPSVSSIGPPLSPPPPSRSTILQPTVATHRPSSCRVRTTGEGWRGAHCYSVRVSATKPSFAGGGGPGAVGERGVGRRLQKTARGCQPSVPVTHSLYRKCEQEGRVVRRTACTRVGR